MWLCPSLRFRNYCDVYAFEIPGDTPVSFGQWSCTFGGGVVLPCFISCFAGMALWNFSLWFEGGIAE